MLVTPLTQKLTPFSIDERIENPTFFRFITKLPDLNANETEDNINNIISKNSENFNLNEKRDFLLFIITLY